MALEVAGARPDTWPRVLHMGDVLGMQFGVWCAGDGGNGDRDEVEGGSCISWLPVLLDNLIVYA